ncbi:Ig-like domain-containing protein [Methanobrevibacter sp. TMH8]|uniref:Ig-like domain-containing protein n=1 Tax=Methanobrevibacter sp. TMH8 TaxID=2848611 RepID=UPI001CCE8AEA|nr:Ig-like domain-containing protein [Methanobrevibacter sp. TMH8]MBZ9570248.1 Ig-like domain-containing protein [Methanobrevibacter sp. TMH8]
MKHKCVATFLILMSFLLLFSLSSVSAGTYNLNNSSSTTDVQDIIYNDNDSDLVINLDEGDYNFDQINISRNATIIGKNKNNVRISGTGTLFNITSQNVKFINLTISGYQTAMMSNTGKLSIIGCNISTSGISVDVEGDGDLSGISIENNTIISSIGTNYRGAVYIYSRNSTVGVSIKNNNILANTGSGDGLRIDVQYCNNSILIENNNITGANDGVDFDGQYGHNIIMLTNNDITGSSRRGFYLYSGHANNTLTATNNKIRAQGHGIYIFDSRTNHNNNSLSITNNDVTSSTTDSLYLGLRESNSNVTIINNNFTTLATSGDTGGIYVDAEYSNNNITITNNNITGLNRSGIYLSSFSSNNTIVISNNMITGMVYGVLLSVYDSNNTITVVNNDIIAMENGVFLNASNSTNSISFLWNNITCIDGLYAMHIYCLNEFSGLSLFNNTFTSSVGLYFELDDATLSNIHIVSNTINTSSMGISIDEFSPSFVNMTVNYNRILAVELGLLFATTDAGSSFDYNWWGLNDAVSMISGFDTNNHYILNITNLNNFAIVRVGDTLNFVLLVLNTTLTNEGVEKMPYFVINGTFNGLNFSSSRDDLFITQFKIQNVGLQSSNASLDQEFVSFEFNAIKSSVIITVDDITAEKGKKVRLVAKLVDQNGKPLADKKVSFYIAGKYIGDAITNQEGIATLDYIPENTGTFQVTAIFLGDKLHNPSEGIGILTIQDNLDNNDNDKNNSDNNDNNNDKDNSDYNVKATMKSTGIPINLLVLVLLSCLGMVIRKKQ